MASCEFNATLPGIVDFVVASATAGHATPEQSGVTTGKVYAYYAQSFDSLGVQTGWESGSGIYTISTHTLKRTTIIANSNGDTNPVNFPLAPIVDVYASPSSSLEPALGACDVWASWTGASGAIQDSFNVSSISRTSAGLYVVNFTKPFASGLYVCSVNYLDTVAFFGFTTSGTRNLGSVGISFLSQTFAAADPNTCMLAMFGRQ